MALAQIRTILLPTDFSDDASVAFVHGLKLALLFGAELDIFHVEPDNDTTDWRWAPSVLATLKRWGVLPLDATEGDVEKLGIRARRGVRSGVAADEAILAEMERSHADLVVMATHGRAGLERWTRPSVSAATVSKGSAPVLLLPAKSAGFVDPATGGASLERVLVPIDHSPGPLGAFAAAAMLMRALPGETMQLATFHVGTNPPSTSQVEADPTWRVLNWTQASGDPAELIPRTAETWNADLVVMTTEGRTGLLDTVRGSTVERLLMRTRTPMLVLPERKRG